MTNTWADWYCSEDGTQLTYWWNNVPTDDRAPGLDNYLTVVYDDVTGQELAFNPGAEDNAHGEPYTVTVTPGHRIWLGVANEAQGFSFDTDAYATCHAQVQEPQVVAAPEWEMGDPISTLLMLVAMLWHGITH